MSYASSKICAHALSTAEFCESLFDYIAWYKRLKCKPSASYLSNISKPKAAGKKGNTCVLPSMSQNRDSSTSATLPQDDSSASTMQISLPSQDDESTALASSAADSNRVLVNVSGSGQIAENHSTNDYFIVFLNNRIKKCYGCGQLFNKALDGTVLPPPSDICILHKDIREFIKNGKTCKSPHPQNTYYHPSIACITKKNKNFETKFLNAQHTNHELLPIHKQFLLKVFGLHL